MALALLAVPHGGAKKIPRTTRVFIQLIKRDTPSGVVKSATETGPDKFLLLHDLLRSNYEDLSVLNKR